MREGRLLVAMVVLAVAMSGCSDDDQSGGGPGARPGSGPAAAILGEDPPKPLARLRLIDIVEHNVDDFRGPLTMSDPAQDAESIAVLDDKVVVWGDVCDSTDAAALKKANIILSDPKVPLSRCRAVVTYTIVYNGVGRIGQYRWYRGLAEWSAVIPVGKCFTQKQFTFDSGSSPQPFETAVRHIRLLPHVADQPAAIGFRPDGDSIEATLGDVRKVIAPGHSTELFANRTKIKVSVKPLLARDVKFMVLDGDREIEQPAGAADAVVEPGVDYGLVDFTTRIRVVNRGMVALYQAPMPASAGRQQP